MLTVTIATASILPGLSDADTPPITLDELRVDGWTTARGPSVWSGGAVEEKIGDVADLHQGYNLISSQWALLRKGDRELDAFVFTYDTPANAYGIFSALRGTMMDAGTAEPVEVGDQALYDSDGALLAWVGRCIITLTGTSADVPGEKALTRIAGQLASQFQGEGHRPELVEKLPVENLSERSIVYGRYRNALDRVLDLGDNTVLGLGDNVDVPTGVEAVYGEYTIDERSHALFAVRYPEEAAARKAEQALAARLSRGGHSDSIDGAWRDIDAGDGTRTLTYRSGRLLAVAPKAVALDTMKAIIREMSRPPAEAAVPPQPMIYRG